MWVLNVAPRWSQSFILRAPFRLLSCLLAIVVFVDYNCNVVLFEGGIFVFLVQQTKTTNTLYHTHKLILGFHGKNEKDQINFQCILTLEGSLY